jgi:hypothetical protein
MTEGSAMQKLTIVSATIAVACVGALAASAFGRSASNERTQVTEGAATMMPTIEQLTSSVENLPAQYYHPI